jgi:hypothetical protein
MALSTPPPGSHDFNKIAFCKLSESFHVNFSFSGQEFFRRFSKYFSYISTRKTGLTGPPGTMVFTIYVIKGIVSRLMIKILDAPKMWRNERL